MNATAPCAGRRCWRAETRKSPHRFGGSRCRLRTRCNKPLALSVQPSREDAASAIGTALPGVSNAMLSGRRLCQPVRHQPNARLFEVTPRTGLTPGPLARMPEVSLYGVGSPNR
jgi:hypothetical protein